MSNAVKNALVCPHYSHLDHTKDKKRSIAFQPKKPKILRGIVR